MARGRDPISRRRVDLADGSAVKIRVGGGATRAAAAACPGLDLGSASISPFMA
jgi:hypothetical protein